MRQLTIAALSALMMTAGCGKEAPKPATPADGPAPTATPGTTEAKGAEAPAEGSRGEAKRPRREIEAATPPPAGDNAAVAPKAGAPATPTPQAPTPTVNAPDPGAVAAKAANGKAAFAPLALAQAPTALTGPASAEALTFLPRDLQGVLVFANPKATYDALGIDGVLNAFKPGVAKAAAEAKENTGYDLTRIETFGELGFDLNGPAGAMLFDPRDERFGFFATVKDAAKLEATIMAVAEKQGGALDVTTIGEAKVLVPRKGAQFGMVIRGNSFFVMGADRNIGPTLQGVAQQSVADSFARTQAFTAAAVQLKGASDGLAWLHLGNAVRSATEFDIDVDHVDGYLTDELEKAKKAGDTAAVERWNRVIANQKAEAASASERMQAQRAMMDKMVGPLEGFAVGLRMRPQAIEIDLFMPIANGALLKTLVRNEAGVSAIVAATTATPLFLGAFTLDIDAYMQLVKDMMAAEGESLDEGFAQAKEMGLDIEKEIVGAMSGAFGFAVHGDVAKIMNSRGGVPQGLGGGLLLGLKDPAKFKAFLGQLAGHPLAAKVVKWDATTGTATIPLPIGVPLTVSVAGKYLVASTDAGFVDRVAAGDGAGSFVGALKNADLKALLARKDQAMVGMYQQALSAAWLTMMFQSSQMPRTARRGVDSPEAKATAKALEAAYAEVDRLDKANEKAQIDRTVAVVNKIGVTAQAVRVADAGFVGTFGQYVNGDSVAKVVGEIATMIAQTETKRRTRDTQTEAAWSKVKQLEADLEALGRKAPMPQKPPTK